MNIYRIKLKFRTHLIGISITSIVTYILVIELIRNYNFINSAYKTVWYIWVFLFIIIFFKLIFERLTYKLNLKDGILKEEGFLSQKRQLPIEKISIVTHSVYTPFEIVGESQNYRSIVTRFSNYNLTWDGNNPFPIYPINSQLLKDLKVLKSNVNINDNEEDQIEIIINKNKIRRVLNLYIRGFFISLIILVFPLIIFIILDGIRAILI